MAVERAPGVKFASTTSGIGAFGIGAVTASFRLPSDVPITNGAEVDYIAFTTTERAVGRGTYDSGGLTISRDTEIPIVGSESGGKINFATAPTVALGPLPSSFADVAFTGDIAPIIVAAAAKTTPVDADTVPLVDSEASNVLKKLSWANIKATLGFVAGVLGISNGGTGASTAAGAFANLKQAASDTATGVIEIAVQSEMEAATNTTLAVTPGRQHFHPGHPKVWWDYTSDATPILNSSYNVTSITDTGVGQTTVNYSTAFSGSTNPAIVTVLNGLASGNAAKYAQPFSMVSTSVLVAQGNIDSSGFFNHADIGRRIFGVVVGDI